MLELLDGDGLSTELIVMKIVGTEDLIYCLEEQASHSAAVLGSLAESEKIVDKDVDVGS